jgi:hypothetical protein
MNITINEEKLYKEHAIKRLKEIGGIASFLKTATKKLTIEIIGLESGVSYTKLTGRVAELTFEESLKVIDAVKRLLRRGEF